MQTLRNKRAVVTGGSRGLGLAIVEALARQEADVIAVARDQERFSSAQAAGARMIAGDATDAGLMNRLVAEEAPDILILNAGAQLPMKPIDRQSWEEFSLAWNIDVQGGFVGITAALHTPMKPGGRILIMSSGAATVLSAPFPQPASLRLSSGYVGAKRMLWFLAHQANSVVKERDLGLNFQVIVPMQVLPGTALGHAVAAVHAKIEGVSAEEHVRQRYGSILPPEELGDRVAELLRKPELDSGVAYGIRHGSDLIPLDV